MQILHQHLKTINIWLHGLVNINLYNFNFFFRFWAQWGMYWFLMMIFFLWSSFWVVGMLQSLHMVGSYVKRYVVGRKCFLLYLKIFFNILIILKVMIRKRKMQNIIPKSAPNELTFSYVFGMGKIKIQKYKNLSRPFHKSILL